MENIMIEKNVVEPLNGEQKEAIESITEFIKRGNPNEWFVLEGKAGTGKTTIMSKAIEPFLGKRRVEICALSHKAKKVLWNKVTSTLIDLPVGLDTHSVAGLLGMTLDMETGKFTKAFSKKKPPIRWADIIVVDEASMINEEALIYIMDSKKPKAKVIFIGDIGQLPPIREERDSSRGKPSPIFLSENKVKLLNRVRQKEDSRILPYSDHYWDNSVLHGGEEEDPVPLESRKTDEHIVFSKDIDKVLKDNKDLFLKSTKEKNNDLIKVIVYRNKTKKSLNWYIRDMIYGNPKEYELGDILIFNDNYYKGDSIIFENSSEVSVLKVTKGEFNGEYAGHILTVTDGEKTESVEVLSEGSKPAWNKYVGSLFEVAKKIPKGIKRNRALKRAWDAKNRFAHIDYAYVLTSHKAQGSTYNTVIVVEDDILDVSMIDNVEKSQSMYVGITRASNKVYIVSELN